MTDFFLLGSNTLIGLLFFGLWWSDRTRSRFAYWGIGMAFMATGGAIVLALRNTDAVTEAPHLIMGGVWFVTTGMSFMVTGSLMRLESRWALTRALCGGVASIVAIMLMEAAMPHSSAWLISLGLILAYGSVSWVIWRNSLLERVAAVLYALCAVNAISLTLSGSFGHNQLQAHISHLLSLAAAICLLLSTFERKTQELAQRNELLSFSNTLITALQEKDDENELASEALRLLTGTNLGRYGLIHVLNKDGNSFDLLAAYRHPEEVLRVVRHMPAEHTLSGMAIRNGDAVVVDDYINEPGAWQALARVYAHTGVKANISIPLMIGARPLGVMNISYPERHDFSKRELDTLKAAGQVIATCLERVQHQRDLAHRANHDDLTGLGNREALHTSFAHHMRNGASGVFALFLLDINRFKEINDTLGHQVGDRVLVEVANALGGYVETIHGEVFRLGGDEFAVLLPRQANEATARGRCQALADLINQPVRIDDMSLHVDVAIGIAFSPRHSSDSHELLRCADVAMYSAKTHGMPFEIYDRIRDVHSPARLKLLGAIPKAINESEFVLHYQPQVDLHNNVPVGYETLIRWQHPQYGLLPPGEFFPLAEVSDVIHPLTDHMVDIAMAQTRQWLNKGMQVRIAINLSARNILDPKLTSRLLELLDKHGLEARHIELELTETALLHDPVTSAKILQGLTEHGFVLALDDFGTGFSSLSYLKRYPFSIVKIDRSFVADMEHDPASLAIVRSTIQLSHELNMKVIAEGVSDQATLDILRKLDCDMAQGYFISRPIEHDAVAAWHTDWLALPRVK